MQEMEIDAPPSPSPEGVLAKVSSFFGAKTTGALSALSAASPKLSAAVGPGYSPTTCCKGIERTKGVSETCGFSSCWQLRGSGGWRNLVLGTGGCTR